ncbi:MAG: FlgD immunoglobulin-like domain containing protein [Candidatus Neomarinimicrobiota bacterium]
MKKALLIILALLMTFSAFGQMTTLWEKSAAGSSMPSWFDTAHLTRGFAYGQVDGQDRLLVVSRNGGNNLYVLNATTGDSLSKLDATGISGGTYHISDAAISEDGDIYVCNLALNTTLKVYKWDDVDSASTLAISFPYTAGRIGDKMSVYGSADDNSLEFFFADVNNAQIVHFSTMDKGVTFVADTIAVEDKGGSSSVALADDGVIYHNSSGNYLKRYEGASSSVISGSVLGTGSNASEFIFTDAANNEYIAVYQYGGSNENSRIIKVPNGDLAEASTYKLTPTLGSNSNANGAGDVGVKDNGDGTYNVYVLSCNNGIGAYKFEFPVPPLDPVNMTSNWEVWGDAYSFFASGGDAARGMGYNPATGNVLIASRSGGAYVHVLDGASGAAIDTLDMTGVTGGFYGISLMKADADDAGVIYACNLASGADFKVYRWADEDAVPTVALQLAVTSRFGDVFEVSGSGVNTKLYASARGATEIKVFGTSDGVNFSEVQSIPIAAAAADGGISVVNEEMLWINAAWKNASLIDTAGTLIAALELPESYYGNVQYIQAANGAKLLAMNTNHNAGNRRKVEVFNVSDPMLPELWASAEMGNIEKSNGNVAGNLKYDLNVDGTITLYQMATNNAIASWTLEVPEVVEILDIADVKADSNNDFVPDLLDSTVTIRGTVFTPNYVAGSTSIYIQDATGGINVFRYGVETSFNKGDIIQVTGTVDHYNGLTELVFASIDDITLLSSDAPVFPTLVSLSDLGEDIEGNYVKVERVKLVDPSAWPAEGSSANLEVTDGVDTVIFRIDSDSDLDGQVAPTWEFDLVGVATQYDFSPPYDDGYQFLGTFYNDLTIYSPVLTELDENFESWTELDPEWYFENIRLANDAYALEGTGKYLGLATRDSAGLIMTPSIEDPQQLTFYISEHTGGSDVWDLKVVLIGFNGIPGDTLLTVSAPGDFDWHKYTVNIDRAGIHSIAFFANPVSSGSFYIDQISVKAPAAEAELSKESVDFATVDVNTNSVVSLYLNNVAGSGAENLIVDSLLVAHNDFTALIDTSEIAAGDSAMITVVYTPTDETADNCTLMVYTSAGVVSATLSGNGKIVWPLDWRVSADVDWMGVTANAPRSMAYSAKSGNLYFVAHPNGYGDYIKAVSTVDGSVIKDLAFLDPMPSAGYIKINAVAATSDGQIFSSNLSSGSTFNLFRNADENADMNLAYSGTQIPIRVGDALAASGEGTDTKVYVSGSGAPFVYVFNTADGENFTLADSIAITAGAASRGIAPVQNGDYLFINGTSTAPMYVKSDGTVLYTFDTAVVPSGTAINYFEVENSDGIRRFVGITNAWSSGTKVVELLGALGDDLCSSLNIIAAPTDNYKVNSNANATGMAIYDVYENALVELITNNGVSAYSFEKIEANPVIPERDTTAIADGVPAKFELYQNYPNPFNPTTTIRFDLPMDAQVHLAIYDISGRKIVTLVNGNMSAGYSQVVWNGSDFNGNPVSSGLYIYKLQANNMIDIKKMTFLK